MAAEFLLTLGYSLVFALVIGRLSFFNIDGIPKKWMLAAFFLKVGAGSLLYLLYTFYYTERSNADIYKYFDDSKFLYDALWSKPFDFFRIMFSIGNDKPYFDLYYGKMNNWYGIYPTNLYGDGHMMIRFHALARIFSLGYLNVHTVFINFLSFTGLIGMLRFFRMSGGRQKAFFLSLFLMPSLLFWGSGVLKEGLLLFSMGIVLFHFRKLAEERRGWWRLAVILGGLIILRFTKFYLLALMLPLMTAWLWSYLSRERHIFLTYAMVVAIAMLLGSQAYRLNPYNNIPELLANKHNGFVQEATESGAGSLFDGSLLKPEWTDILMAAVPGFFNTVFRPLLWEVNNPLILMSALENLVIILLIACMIVVYSRPENKNHFLFSLFFFMMIYTVSGLITPVSGALVRYKIVAFPFLFYLVFSSSDSGRVRRFAGKYLKRRKI